MPISGMMAMVEKEVAMPRRRTAARSFGKDAVRTLELTRMARALRVYVINRMGQKRLSAFRELQTENRVKEEKHI